MFKYVDIVDYEVVEVAEFDTIEELRAWLDADPVRWHRLETRAIVM